jgi:hypothetical protein
MRKAVHYYAARRWGSFTDPVYALVTAGFSEEFARAKIRRATDEPLQAQLFSIKDGTTSVVLVNIGTKLWDRWCARLLPLFSSPEEATTAAAQMDWPSGVSGVAGAFKLPERHPVQS